MKTNHQKKFLIVLLAVICVLASTVTLPAHDYRIPLLVDTDMALDDVRALIMLFNLDMADIHLITTSDGALAPCQGKHALQRLLTRIGQEKIPLAAGRELGRPDPAWRVWTAKILCGPDGNGAGKVPFVTASRQIVETLRRLPAPSIFLCLGPLTNLADALAMDPGIKVKISRIVYMGSQPVKGESSWNTERDMAAAKKVLAAGPPVYLLDIPKLPSFSFDDEYFLRVAELNSPAAKLLTSFHEHPEVQSLLKAGHFKICDELAVIYLERPDFFRFVAAGRSRFQLANCDEKKVRSEYIRTLGYASDLNLESRQTVVLEKFPGVPNQFQADLRPWVAPLIEKHGLEEWKAAVLTNEFHRHLGIYSIVGVKMGIRAREVLGAPFDDIGVVSLAGNDPPLSCLNDGLQIATGASLGRGNISIEGGSRVPGATFSFNQHKLTLTLKKEIVQKIENNVQRAILDFGNLSPQYFARIRQLSIQYWLDLDRALIFDERQ